MDTTKENLYDAMGELIYALALADGVIQDEELQSLEEILKKHPWAAAIRWSFDYEKQKSKSLEQAYQKAIDVCKHYGPSEEYAFLLEVLQMVAEASDGVVPEEANLIDGFRTELTDYFKNNLA